MTITANDAISFNSLRSNHRRRSLTRSPPPPPKIPNFCASPTPTTIPVPSSSPRTRKHQMTLRHRQPTSNGVNGVVISRHEVAANGDARKNLVDAKHTTAGAKQRDDATVKKGGHARPPIDWEVPRKLLHSSIGFFTIPLYVKHIPASDVAFVLSAAFTFIASADFIRLRNRSFNVLYKKVLGFLMRESENERVNGVIWYLLGCIFVVKFYPEDIAVVSILMLSWCDTFASIFGRLYGHQTSRLPQSMRLPFTSLRLPLPFAQRKSVAGFIAGSVTGALIVFGFWRWLAPLGAQPSSLPRIIQGNSQPIASLAKFTSVALVSGLLAGFAEAIDIGSLDDNLTLPIVSGGLIWALFKCVEYIF